MKRCLAWLVFLAIAIPVFGDGFIVVEDPHWHRPASAGLAGISPAASTLFIRAAGSRVSSRQRQD
jgi:hypothetical protein